MGDSKKSTNRTGTNNVVENSSRTNISNGQMGTSANNQSNSLSNKRQWGGNTKNNGSSASMRMANKDFKG